jgi:hypothetical protein
MFYITFKVILHNFLNYFAKIFACYVSIIAKNKNILVCTAVAATTKILFSSILFIFELSRLKIKC